MQCPGFREAASARLDGESPGSAGAELDAHLARCPACATWVAEAAAVTRRARLAPAPPVPDLTRAVLTALPPRLPGGAAAARARLLTSALRLSLLAVGVAQALLAWPALGTGAGAMSAPAHLTHETLAWNVAAGAAIVAVAVAPRLAAGTLPFLGTFAVLLTVVTAHDLAAGHVHADRAMVHVLLVAGAALVAAAAWRGRRRAAGAGSRERAVA